MSTEERIAKLEARVRDLELRLEQVARGSSIVGPNRDEVAMMIEARRWDGRGNPR